MTDVHMAIVPSLENEKYSRTFRRLLKAAAGTQTWNVSALIDTHLSAVLLCAWRNSKPVRCPACL